MSVTKRYYVRKKEIDNNRMIDGRTGSASELLDIKQYIEQVVDEHLTIDDGILSSTTDLELTAAEDLTIAATAGDVIINAGDDIILTPTANLTFTLAAIPTYADDTAAGVGLLTAGQVYKTAAGALMIKL